MKGAFEIGRLRQRPERTPPKPRRRRKNEQELRLQQQPRRFPLKRPAAEIVGQRQKVSMCGVFAQ